MSRNGVVSSVAVAVAQGYDKLEGNLSGFENEVVQDHDRERGPADDQNVPLESSQHPRGFAALMARPRLATLVVPATRVRGLRVRDAAADLYLR